MASGSTASVASLSENIVDEFSCDISVNEEFVSTI
jgi:hypothetical protein